MDRLDEIIEFCEDQIRYNETMMGRNAERDIWVVQGGELKIKNPDVFAYGVHVGQRTIIKHLTDMLKEYRDGH